MKGVVGRCGGGGIWRGGGWGVKDIVPLSSKACGETGARTFPGTTQSEWRTKESACGTSNQRLGGLEGARVVGGGGSFFFFFFQVKQPLVMRNGFDCKKVFFF